MALSQDPHRLSDFIDQLINNERCEAHIKERYPKLWATFIRFALRTGPHCPFARGAAKGIIAAELSDDPLLFQQNLNSKRWESSRDSE